MSQNFWFLKLEFKKVGLEKFIIFSKLVIKFWGIGGSIFFNKKTTNKVAFIKYLCLRSHQDLYRSFAQDI